MRPPAPQKPQTRGRLRVFFFCLLAFVAGFGAGAGWLSARAARPAPPVPPVSVSATGTPSGAREEAPSVSATPSPQREEAADSEQEASAPTAPAPSPLSLPTSVPSGVGRVALVVDDMGYDLAVARRLAGLGLPLTWAILPDAPHAAATAKIARDAGIPYLVHLPMQAQGDGDDGPYAVASGWSAEVIRERSLRAFEALPGAFGVNNHRGSRATADRVAMERFLSVLQEARPGWIFLDSRTNGASCGFSMAREKGIRTSRNDRFLDHRDEDEAIRAAFEAGASLARRKGQAILIGHPRPRTVHFLERLSRGDAIPPGVELETLPDLMGLVSEEAGGGRP